MTDQPLLIFAMLGCGLASALILFRAATVVYLRNQARAAERDEV
ncbi:hypothetical protein [Fertoeibacter niger]|nr:hypothetical protein [Fertoeibacter niger]